MTGKVCAGFAVLALSLFAGKALVVSQAHAQTGRPHFSVSVVPDFENDVQQGKQDIAGDSAAQSDQQEISGEDDESAGDAQGDQMEVDGENSQDQIDSEIEHDAEQEDASDAEQEGSHADASSTNESTESGN